MLKDLVKKKINGPLNAVQSIRPLSQDAFVTYDPSIEDKVNRLYSMMVDSVDATFCIDKPNVDIGMTKEYAKLMRQMLRCTLVICCINQEYLVSRRCRDVLTIAYTNSKPLVLLLFHDLQLKDMPTILFAIDGAARVPVFKFIKGRHAWNGQIMLPEITVPMQVILNRKIEMKKLPQRRETSSLIDDSLLEGSPDSGFDRDVDEDDDDDEKSGNEELSALDLEMKKISAAEASNNVVSLEKAVTTSATVSEGDSVFVDPSRINLRLAKRSPLFTYASGYNRVAFLESKKRFLITSSYNKTITSIDKSGNWIEKRNPGNLLKLPWAICVSAKNDIFVGDNDLKCIFQFDQNFKHLRTFGKNLLNGYFDMVIDDKPNELYACNLYDSLVAIIDIKHNVIKHKITISVPTFIRLFPSQIAITTADDTLFILKKHTHDLVFKIEIENSKYLTALSTYGDDSVFVTSQENNDKLTNQILNNEQQQLDDSNNSCPSSPTEKFSRQMCLSMVKICGEKDIRIKKLNLEVGQVNDMVLREDSIVFIDDTHLTIFEYSHIDKLLDWEENVKSSIQE